MVPLKHLKLASVLVVLALALIVPHGQASYTEPFWIKGRISSAVVEQRFSDLNFTVCYVFNMTVAESNASWIASYPVEASVVAPSPLFILKGKPVEGGIYNFSGFAVNLREAEVPSGWFIVTGVEGTSFGESDLVAMFRIVIGIMGSVMGYIVKTVVQLIYVGVGYEVPELAITLVMVGLMMFFLFKYYKVISVLILLVLGFLVVSGVASLIHL